MSVISTHVSGCGEDISGSSSGHIYSPKDPTVKSNGNDDNLTCQWLITLNEGRTLVFTFFEMDLLSGKDSLQVSDKTL